ncbi:hypothetical protein [Paenibacillus pini]|uniref:Uncharacterized protein n=1 Tax=Paenibacillus pini JCM 16418 TaxID=1236976 RepID=W7YEC5_9BACL|nr:hypothetical protein [Paenibacillus pini]GAF06837.1 hypothetical protein JCM16418_820 [Paenibacillus pini JCM 16418]
MNEELHIAATYQQRVILKLHDGEEITGKAQVSTDPLRIKLKVSEGYVWVPIEDIEEVNRLVQLH